MNTFNATRIGLAILSAVSLPYSAIAAESENSTETIELCLNMGTGVPSALVYDACNNAFSIAIQEAQKTETHSQQMRDLLWMQASTSASLAMMSKVTLDGNIGDESCHFARAGLQSDNQVSASWKEKFPDLSSTKTLEPIFSHCDKSGYYDHLKGK